jgi:hypothetical protein
MRIRLTTDLLTGLFFIGIGLFAIIYGWNYPFGTAVRIGPGYFPKLVASGLLMLGLILVGRSLLLATENEEISVVFRPLLVVLAGTLAFGLLVERAGFVLAGFVLVFATRFADRDFRLAEVTLLAAVLVTFIALMFWLGLSLPLRPFPKFD